MWLALRFAVFAVAFCIRAWARVSHGDADDSIDGRPSYRKVLKQPKSKSIVGFRLGVDLVAPVVMRMHRESGLDLWFKALGLAREVQHDPVLALDGGPDGSVLIRTLISDARAHLQGLLALEIGHDQSGPLTEALSGAGYHSISPESDYSGRNRFLFASYG
jgi:hypothetical protein